MTEILTAEQLAERLGLNPESVRRLTRDGTLPHHRIGASVRYILADVMAHTAVNKHPDDEAVDTFAQAMHLRMAQARAQEKEGWERYPSEYLEALLASNVEAEEWVDVANYAMMLHFWHEKRKPAKGATPCGL